MLSKNNFSYNISKTKVVNSKFTYVYYITILEGNHNNKTEKSFQFPNLLYTIY